MPTQELIPHSTILRMAEQYKEAEGEIRAAFETLEKHQKALTETFGTSRYMLFDSDTLGTLRLDRFLEKLERGLWKSIVDRSEIRRVMSVKRTREINDKLETDKLPPLTEEEIIKMMRSIFENVRSFAEEAVYEVFDMLRPHRTGYVTNKDFAQAIGKRVILPRMVERYDAAYHWRPGYGRADIELRALDSVFHVLDGKGFGTKTYAGELFDAIASDETKETNRGETTYFKFKCFKNGNLHIEFKRMDLVEKMNVMVHERSLREAQAA